MFESLTGRLHDTFNKLTGRGRISDENVRDAFADIRLALLDADVHLDVVNAFMEQAMAQAQGQKVVASLQPGQVLVKIVYDELVKLMGPVDSSIFFTNPGPTVILMCGLQGSGKTTTSGKLARFIASKGRRPLLVAADLQRPAAVEQLRVIGEQISVPVFTDLSRVAPHGQVTPGASVALCRAALQHAKKQGNDVVIVDTAGRLHVDDDLMGELKDLCSALSPQQIYLVLDAMSGQDAVVSAKAFNEKLEIDGLILTKFDSDTRGGAMLSAKWVTGKPIKFIGVGEKMDAIEEFRPEGYAQRMLGMGDVVGLVNQAIEKLDQDEAARLQEKAMKGQFTLEDFIAQLRQVRKLGSFSRLMGMIPGVGRMMGDMKVDDSQVESELSRLEALYGSMTAAERRDPNLIEGSRRRRIAKGAGMDPMHVSAFIKQFDMVKNMSKAVGSMGMAGRMGMMKQMMSGNLAKMAAPGGPQLRLKGSGWQEKKDRNKKRRR